MKIVESCSGGGGTAMNGVETHQKALGADLIPGAGGGKAANGRAEKNIAGSSSTVTSSPAEVMMIPDDSREDADTVGGATTLGGGSSTSRADDRTSRATMTRRQVRERANVDRLLLVIVRDRVYDLTRWQRHHPGGHLTVRALCGKDATDPFLAVHPATVEETMLDKFYYADLDERDAVVDDATAAFRKLTDELESSGWFQTEYGVYYRKAALFAGLFGLVVACVLYRGDRQVWVHALGGVLLGLFWQQIAFVGHDIGHNSVTHDRETDSWMGLFVGNFCTGISIGWWKRSHNVHHIVTNSCEHDPDIQHLPVFAVNSMFLSQPIFSTFYSWYLPLDRVSHLLVRQQHWLYYPIMAVARFNLYAQSLTHALGVGAYDRAEKLWRRELQVLSLVGFWVWLLALTLQLPSWRSRVAFFMLAHNVAGILHVQITLSHFCMPSYSGVTYDDADNGYINTQLQGSLNVDCAPWMDWFHGGLQFQVEHHLWPRIPRHKLRKLRPILKEFCRANRLDYHEETFFRANVIMLAKLRQVAASAMTFSELFSDSINLRG